MTRGEWFEQRERQAHDQHCELLVVKATPEAIRELRAGMELRGSITLLDEPDGLHTFVLRNEPEVIEDAVVVGADRPLPAPLCTFLVAAPSRGEEEPAMVPCMLPAGHDGAHSAVPVDAGA